MIGLIELIVFGFLGLSVVYILVGIYARSTEREKLERAFDAAKLQGDISGDRDAYIAAGLLQYQHSLRRKLLGLVYVIPMMVILVTAYLVNAQ